MQDATTNPRQISTRTPHDTPTGTPPLKDYDPAAEIATRFPHWRIVDDLLPDDVNGYTEAATCTILIDRRLTAAERRSTLAHELVHVELGHDGPQSDMVETAVEMIAADRLLGDAATHVEQSALRSVAGQLQVDTGILTAWRLGRLLAGAS